jgi:predicted nucleic acid-binding protein
MKRTLVDAGPLVAFFNEEDAHHNWATSHFRQLRGPLLTAEPVLAEAAYHVGKEGGDPALLLDWVNAGVLTVGLDLEEEAAALAALMRRYADQPMDLADACLVRLTELIEDCQVFTVDRDFKVYRRGRRFRCWPRGYEVKWGNA